MSEVKKYKEIFFWKNFINSIKSLKILNNNNGNYMMILEDDFF